MEPQSSIVGADLHRVHIPQNPDPSPPTTLQGDSVPSTPTDSSTLAPLDSPLDVPPRTYIRLASAFMIFFVLGWGDGATGSLLPYFKADFRLTFMTSSLCFVASTIGYACGTLLVERLLGVAGRIYLRPGTAMLPMTLHLFRQQRSSDTVYVVGHSASLANYIVIFSATLLHPIFFIVMGFRKNFPSMLVAYVISAFARALLSATINFFCTSTSKRALGYLYGFWSIGSMCAPLVCQTIIAHGVAWNHFYFGSLVLSALSSALAFFAFRPTSCELELDGSRALNCSCEQQIKEIEKPVVVSGLVDEANIAELAKTIQPVPSRHALGRALRHPMVWAFAIFCGLYTGDEASTQGFIVTYLLRTRGANPNVVGYTTSGFWGGLALSRFLWGFFNTRLSFRQRKYAIYVCITGLALSMHLLIWFVASFVENAFSVAVVGLAYGPIFPGNMGQASEVFPEDLRMIGMAIMAAFGSLGAAVFPFLTGTLSNLEGPQTFTYIVVSLTSSLLCVWCFLPSSIPVRSR